SGDTARSALEWYGKELRDGLPSLPECARVLAAGLDRRGVGPALGDSWLARASRYGGPLLLVWGRQDTVMPAHHVADVHRILPQAQVRLIDRCGHVPMIECPEEFLDAVIPFLDRAERAAAA